MSMPSRMIPRTVVTAFAWALLGALSTAADPAEEVGVGEKMPDVEFGSLFNGDGRTRLSQFLGQPILIQYFCDCEYCTSAIPSATELARKYGDQGLEVILMEFKSSELEAALAPVCGPALASGALVATNTRIPIRFEDQGWPPQVVLVGIDGTVKAAAGNRNLGSKLEKMVVEELRAAQKGWGDHPRIRKVRALMYGRNDLAGALEILLPLEVGDEHQADLLAVREELETRITSQQKAVEYLVSKGEWSRAQQAAQAFADAVEGNQIYSETAEKLLATFETKESRAELDRERQLDKLLKVLESRGPEAVGSKRFEKLAEKAPSDSRVAMRALHLARVVALANSN